VVADATNSVQVLKDYYTVDIKEYMISIKGKGSAYSIFDKSVWVRDDVSQQSVHR